MFESVLEQRVKARRSLLGTGVSALIHLGLVGVVVWLGARTKAALEQGPVVVTFMKATGAPPPPPPPPPPAGGSRPKTSTPKQKLVAPREIPKEKPTEETPPEPVDEKPTAEGPADPDGGQEGGVVSRGDRVGGGGSAVVVLDDVVGQPPHHRRSHR